MKKATVSSLLLTIVISLTIGCGERPFKLRLKFKPGDIYKYKLTQDATTTTEFMGKKMEMPSRTEVALNQKVEKVEQDTAEITITYDSYNMEMNIGGKKIPSSMGTSMVGKTTTMKLNANGEIIEPKGIKSMVALQGLGTDINNLLFSLYPKFPDHKLKIGDSWTQKEELPQSQMNVVVESKYTYARREEKKGYPCAVIDYTVSLNIQGGDAAEMKVKGTGTGKGNTYVAYDKGMIIESKVDMDLTMSIAAPLPMGVQEIPTSTHQTIEMTLL